MVRQSSFVRPLGMALFSAAFAQLIAADASASSSGGVSSALSSNTIILDAPVRESVSVETVKLDYFSSEKVGLSFVIR